jgi:hypothetical protein
VPVPAENGFALLMTTVAEIYNYVTSVIVITWWYISWAIITPFARAGTCISEWASAVYNFKLPGVALPDINNYSLVPASAREFTQSLREDIPAISSPPFKEWPIINSILHLWSNINILGSITTVGNYLLCLVVTLIAFSASALSSILTLFRDLASSISIICKFALRSPKSLNLAPIYSSKYHSQVLISMRTLRLCCGCLSSSFGASSSGSWCPS